MRPITDDETRILLVIAILSVFATIVGSNGFRAFMETRR